MSDSCLTKMKLFMIDIPTNDMYFSHKLLVVNWVLFSTLAVMLTEQ